MTKEEKENAINFDKELTKKIADFKVYDDISPKKKKKLGKIIIVISIITIIGVVLIIK